MKSPLMAAIKLVACKDGFSEAGGTKVSAFDNYHSWP